MVDYPQPKLELGQRGAYWIKEVLYSISGKEFGALQIGASWDCLAYGHYEPMIYGCWIDCIVPYT
jgi:hypothetical protein